LKIGSVKMKMKYIFEIQLVGLWCLTPLSSNFSYIVADSFIAVPGKPRYPEKTCHLLQVTDKLYHLMFYRVPYDHDYDAPFLRYVSVKTVEVLIGDRITKSKECNHGRLLVSLLGPLVFFAKKI
jgi:hypothetical protein